jgi:hypothetical protein
MHHTISKAQIEQAIHLAEKDGLENRPLVELLQGLLAQPEQTTCNEDLATDIECIECIDVMYRGAPSYEHDGYYMREAAAKLIRKGYPLYTQPAHIAQSEPQEPQEPVEEFKVFNQMWQWKAFKDGEIIYQYGEHVPALFQKSAKLLPTSAAGIAPIVEDDGSDWFYKLQFICRVLQGVSPDKTDMQAALSMAQLLKRERWTVEKALQPIVVNDVTDEMVAAYHTTTSSSKEAVLRIVNAYLKAKT